MRKISVVAADEPVKTRMSRRSVIGTMDKFVQAVDNMNEIVMVPSLLMDKGFNEEQNNSADLHSFYSFLNTVRHELLFGTGINMNNNNNMNNVGSEKVSFVVGGRSTASRRMSSASSSSMDSSDIDYYSESLMSESELSSLEPEEVSSARLTKNFQHHLLGLCRSLKQLTQSADTLTTIYKSEVENQSSN